MSLDAIDSRPDNGLTCECGHDVAYHVTSLAPSACWAACEAACREFKSAELAKVRKENDRLKALEWWKSCTPEEQATANYYADLEGCRRDLVALRTELAHYRQLNAPTEAEEIDTLKAENAKLREECAQTKMENGLWSSIISQIRVVLEVVGLDTKETPPMMFPEAIATAFSTVAKTRNDEVNALRTKLAARDGLIEELKELLVPLVDGIDHDNANCPGDDSCECGNVTRINRVLNEAARADR